MRAYGPGRTRAREPFPWFFLVLIALAAVGLVAISAARIYRFHLVETAREAQWRAEHEALIREALAVAPPPAPPLPPPHGP